MIQLTVEGLTWACPPPGVASDCSWCLATSAVVEPVNSSIILEISKNLDYET